MKLFRARQRAAATVQHQSTQFIRESSTSEMRSRGVLPESRPDKPEPGHFRGNDCSSCTNVSNPIRCWHAAAFWACGLLMIAAPLIASAANIQIVLAPLMAYRADGVGYHQDRYPDPLADTAQQAFSAATAYWNFCEPSPSGLACYSAINFRPFINPANVVNGYPSHYFSDIQICAPNVGCSVAVFTYYGAIQTDLRMQCPREVVSIDKDTHAPAFFSLTQTGTDGHGGMLYGCVVNFPEVKPCPDCMARSNPIHPGTGEKHQVESDYSSAGGTLAFTRTYRSSNGFFSSVASQSWIDGTAPNVTSTGCRPGT